MRSHRSFLASLITAAVGLSLLCMAPGYAQRTTAAPAPANAELQSAFEAAQSSAKAGDSLDPAYELLGVAGTAWTRDIKPLAASAANAFVDLVQRATAAAQRKRGSFARDTLDQLVDLRFLARSEEIDSAQKAIDTAMRTLFPPVSESLQHDIDAARDWDERLDQLNDLGSLQASAVQVMMNDIAKAIGAAFDARAAAFDTAASQEADDAERARRLGSVAEAKRSREQQVADATINNVETVAAQIKAGGGDSPRAGGGRGAKQDASGDMSCIETGYRTKPIADKNQSAHDRECVDSGRMPGTARCPTANVSLACYARVPDGERITYVYRNTPEETAVRKACASDDLLPANRIPTAGAPFRSRELSLAYVCAPTGDAASD